MRPALHILFVTNTYPTAMKPGDSPQIRDQIEALKLRGVNVDMIFIDRHITKWNYARAAWKIFLLSFQERRYDLIHAYYGHCGFLALLQFSYPVVTTFLGSDLLHPRDGAIGKVAARFANGIIVQSEEMRRVVKREDICIIPFGVNLNLFTPSPKQEARQELGFNTTEKLVLFPWDPERPVKRYDVIQESIQIVQQRYNDVRIVSVYDRPHAIIARYMSCCDVMVLASDHEGSPMAVREAMACNLPIVSVDVGDVRQIIENVEGCYLCEREPGDIAEKVMWVFEQDRRTEGARFIRQIDADWCADQVLVLYDAILESSSGRRRLAV